MHLQKYCTSSGAGDDSPLQAKEDSSVGRQVDAHVVIQGKGIRLTLQPICHLTPAFAIALSMTCKYPLVWPLGGFCFLPCQAAFVFSLPVKYIP